MPSMEMETSSSAIGSGENTFAAFLLMWFPMLIFMMLPLVTPVILKFYHLVRQQVSQKTALRLSSIFAMGYLLPWVAFGFIVGLVMLTGQLDTQLAGSQPLSVTALLLIAGLYQFTPLKTSFLSCHQPSLCLKTHGKRIDVKAAFAMGSQYGSSCLGSCWGLMLALLVVDAMSWALMGFVAAIILAERVVRWRFPVRYLVGLGLIGFGIWTATRSL